MRELDLVGVAYAVVAFVAMVVAMVAFALAVEGVLEWWRGRGG